MNKTFEKDFKAGIVFGMLLGYLFAIIQFIHYKLI